jgi:hypothetical protein
VQVGIRTPTREWHERDVHFTPRTLLKCMLYSPRTPTEAKVYVCNNTRIIDREHKGKVERVGAKELDRCNAR